MSDVGRRCCVGGGFHSCELPEGHDGMHYVRIGAGSVSWSREHPLWTGPATGGRYVYPGSPEYGRRLEQLREFSGHKEDR